MEASERRRRVSEEAAWFWMQMQDSRLPRAEREEIVDWLQESPVHVAEMLHVARLEGALEQFQGWDQVVTDAIGDAPKNVVALPVSSRQEHTSDVSWNRSGTGVRWLTAASMAFLVVAAIWLASISTPGTIQTERGERRAMELADGTGLQLDPETRLRVKMSGDSRQVFLDAGRVMFRVVRNPQRPFVVHADATLVRAIGTAFAVERRPDLVLVTVAEGKVAIESPPNTTHAVPVIVAAGEQIAVPRIGALQPVRTVDTDRELAWTEGRLVFQNDSVSRVAEQFNRYNSVQVHVNDAALASRLISGVFDASDPESFIAFIQGVTAVRVIRDGTGDITLATDDTGS